MALTIPVAPYIVMAEPTDEIPFTSELVVTVRLFGMVTLVSSPTVTVCPEPTVMTSFEVPRTLNS